MDKLIGFKIWYSDGMTITSKTNKWVHTPIHHVQIFKKFYDNKKPEIISGYELYCISSNPLEIEKLIKEDIRNIKIGEKVDDPLFHALLGLARLDKEIIKVLV